MTYDRDEWRQPWRSGEGPVVQRPGVRPLPDLPPPEARATSSPDPADGAGGARSAGSPQDGTPAATARAVTPGVAHAPGVANAPGGGQVPTGPGGEAPAASRDALTSSTDAAVATPGAPAAGRADSWRRPDGAGTAAPAAGVDPSQPIVRFPQPPPTGWDERSSGPGSPTGSVRPPDTTGTVEAPASRPRGRSPLLLLVVAVVGGLIGAGAVVAIAELTGQAEQAETDATGDTVAAPSIEPLSESSVVPAVAEAVTPSVVRIDVSSGDETTMDGMGAGLGSGVIYRSDGYVLTNFHVVDGANDVMVRLASGDVLEAEVVGTDELNDLAVLQVEGTDLPAINFRPDDEPLIVGETVVAIGSPFGLDASVTTGIISALNREIRLDEQDGAGGVLTIPSVLQTDAAINPGNSGGALVDAQGRLVGVNTAILTRTGASQGVGFAVSVEQALSSADQLIDQGFVRHPLLGISGVDVTPDVAEQFGLEATQGAVVESVQDDTGAAEADIRPGDIIIEVDGEQLATMGELVAEVRRREPGDVVVLEVVRNGEQVSVDVELGERPR